MLSSVSFTAPKEHLGKDERIMQQEWPAVLTIKPVSATFHLALHIMGNKKACLIPHVVCDQ